VVNVIVGLSFHVLINFVKKMLKKKLAYLYHT